MFGGINPKKLQGMMKQLGINQEEIAAERVVIEKLDGKIIIDNPSVTKVNMQGQDTWQIVGDVREEAAEEDISDADVDLVAEKTKKSREEARKALEETGDIAEAIMWLSS